MSTLKVPSWLNSDFFEEILSKSRKDDSIIKVRDVKIEPATSEGYLSMLLRVYVNYTTGRTQPLIVKFATTHELAVQKVGANGYDVHNKEMAFYDEVAHEILRLLNKIGHNEFVIPKAVAVNRDLEVIILEDLKPEGFEMVDRFVGLDEPHMKLSLEKLAKFHAASLMILQKNPKAFDYFDSGMFSRTVDAFNDGVLCTFELLVEEVATWPGYESYANKMERMKESFIENATRCFDVEPGELIVLNHGDLWTNNVMYTHNSNGDVTDAILIDFQFCHFGSPVLDVIHLLCTSFTDDLFNQEKIEELALIYYDYFKEALTKLDYDMTRFLTLEQYQRLFDDKMFYGMVFTLCIFPVWTFNDPHNDFQSHHSRDDRALNFKRKMLKSPRYQEIAKRMLPVYERKGLLDF